MTARVAPIAVAVGLMFPASALASSSLSITRAKQIAVAYKTAELQTERAKEVKTKVSPESSKESAHAGRCKRLSSTDVVCEVYVHSDGFNGDETEVEVRWLRNVDAYVVTESL